MEWGNKLLCSYQINDHASAQKIQSNHHFYDFNKAAIVVPSLVPCEICHRTFLPESLEKHNRGCQTSFLKHKERECNMLREKNIFINPMMNKGILSVEEMSFRRRQRQIYWRSKHEEFVKAVYEDKSKRKQQPPSRLESDFVRCPYCKRRYHENDFKRHVTRCKRQHTTIEKDSPGYKTIEINRQLVARLSSQMALKSTSDAPTNYSSSSTSPKTLSQQTTKCNSIKTESSMDSQITNTNPKKEKKSLKLAAEKVKNEIPIKQQLHNNRSQSVGKPNSALLPISNHKLNSNLDRISTQSIIAKDDGLTDHLSKHKRIFSSTVLKHSSKEDTLKKTMPSKIHSENSDCNSNKLGKCNSGWNLIRSTSFLSNLENCLSFQSNEDIQYYTDSCDTKIYQNKPFSCGKSSTNERSNWSDSKKEALDSSKTIQSTFEISTKYMNSFHKSGSSSRSEKTSCSVTRNRSKTCDVDRHHKNSHKTKYTKLQHDFSNTKQDVNAFEEIEKVLREQSQITKKVIECRPIPKLVKSEIVSDLTRSSSQFLKSTENLDSFIGNLSNDLSQRSRSHTKIQLQQENDLLKIVNRKTNEVSSNLHSTKIIVSKKSDKQGEKVNETFIRSLRQTDFGNENCEEYSKIFMNNCNSSGATSQKYSQNVKKTSVVTVIPNARQFKSSGTVSISNKNHIVKYRSSISLKNSLNYVNQNKEKIDNSSLLSYFCEECGHMYSTPNAMFCCSCGCKRSGT